MTNPDARRLVVSIDDQTLRVIEKGECVREFQVSTAIKGMGCAKDSYRTPTGEFRICGKIGGEQPWGTIFKARVPVGLWRTGESPDADLVLTRILRLDGLDSENKNTLERCVYIHGTNREDLIGRPAGHGCVRLRNDDMIELFDMVSENDLLQILPAARAKGKLLFITSGAVLSTCDGIEVMAGCRGDETRREVMEIMRERSEGSIDFGSAFVRCMESIRPDRAFCEVAAAHCIAALDPGANAFIKAAKEQGWLPVLLASVPELVAGPMAKALGIDHFEAPRLHFDTSGMMLDASPGYPMTGDFRMHLVVRDWLESFLPLRSILLAKEPPDNEIQSLVDRVINVDLISDSRPYIPITNFILALDERCK